MARVLRLQTNRPTQVEVTWTLDGEAPTQVQFSDFAETHTLPVVGFKADKTYDLVVTVTDDDGGQLTADDLTVRVAPLPDWFPTVEVLASEPGVAPGMTLACLRPGNNGPYSDLEYLMVIDSDGDVIWYYEGSPIITDVRQLPSGNLLGIEGETATEWNVLGGKENVWIGEMTEPEGGEIVVAGLKHHLHHDLVPFGESTMFSLTIDEVVVPDYPSNYTNVNATSEATIAGESIVEFDRDGTLIETWSLTDLLDRHRIGFDSLGPRAEWTDWGHANTIVYDQSDDTLIASLRHQDAVVKLSRATGELIWILGNHDNWGPDLQPYLLTPRGAPFEWQYHQHAPMLGGGGKILMMDNGNARTSPFLGEDPMAESESYSRVVEFEVDEDSMEIQQNWEYRDSTTGGLYSPAMGDADYLENGNVLAIFGSVSHESGVALGESGAGTHSIRIVEFKPGTPNETVFELRLTSPKDDNRSGWTGNRVQRITSLYPSL